MAQCFQSLNEFPSGAGGVEPVEVIVAQFFVRCTGPEHLKGDGEDLVAGGDDRLGPASPAFDPVKKCAQISFLAV